MPQVDWQVFEELPGGRRRISRGYAGRWSGVTTLSSVSLPRWQISPASNFI